jgi:hypothetical protein
MGPIWPASSSPYNPGFNIPKILTPGAGPNGPGPRARASWF